MKNLTRIDIVARLAIAAIVIGISITGYMYHIGKF